VIDLRANRRPPLLLPVLLLLLPLLYPAATPAAARDAGPGATTFPALPDSLPAVPFGPGEELEFSIDYGPINAGSGTLAVTGLVETDGHVCYRIESRARSNSFFSAFYRVRDRVISHVDVVNLHSRFFSKRLREGDYRKNITVHFDEATRQAVYRDGRRLDIPWPVHDALSAFYAVRARSLRPGDVYYLDTHSSRRNYQLKVVVHRRETIKVPAGTFDCVLVEPVNMGEGLFKHEGQLLIWVSDDARRLPVLMKSKVKVGAIDASLKAYRLGRPLAAEERR